MGTLWGKVHLIARLQDDCGGDSLQAGALGVCRALGRASFLWVPSPPQPSADHAQHEHQEQQIEERRHHHCRHPRPYSISRHDLQCKLHQSVNLAAGRALMSLMALMALRPSRISTTLVNLTASMNLTTFIVLLVPQDLRRTRETFNTQPNTVKDPQPQIGLLLDVRLTDQRLQHHKDKDQEQALPSMALGVTIWV